MTGEGGGVAAPAGLARRFFGVAYVDLFMRRAFRTRSVAQQARRDCGLAKLTLIL